MREKGNGEGLGLQSGRRSFQCTEIFPAVESILRAESRNGLRSRKISLWMGDRSPTFELPEKQISAVRSSEIIS